MSDGVYELVRFEPGLRMQDQSPVAPATSDGFGFLMVTSADPPGKLETLSRWPRRGRGRCRLHVRISADPAGMYRELAAEIVNDRLARRRLQGADLC